LWLTQSREATWCLGEGRGFGEGQRPFPSPSPSLLRLFHSQERAMPPNKELSPQRAAGCVVYRYDGRAPLVLLILDKYGRWTLPKGHLKAGESEEQAAMREVLEETAVAGTLGPLVGRIAYMVMKNAQPRAKQVAFFLLRAADDRAVPQAEEGIAAAEW